MPTALTLALRAARASMTPVTAAAPPMSVIISSMPAGPLHADPAAVEAHALADEGHRLSGGVARPLPLDNGELPSRTPPLPDADEAPHAELLHFLFAEDLDFETMLGELLDPARKFLGEEDVGRLGDQVAGEDDGVGKRIQRFKRLGGGFWIIDGDLDPPHRRLLVRLFGRPVLIEAVGRQTHAEGGGGPLLRRHAAHPHDQG